MAQFLIRCAGDFPDHPQLRTLLLLEPVECNNSAQTEYRATLPYALARLTTPHSQALFNELIERCTPEEQATTHFARSFVHHELGRTEEAIADYTAVIEMPDAPENIRQIAQEALQELEGE